MLSRSRHVHLCGSCRNDLLAIFEYGLNPGASPQLLPSTQPLRPRYLPAARSSHRQQQVRRAFSGVRTLRSDNVERNLSPGHAAGVSKGQPQHEPTDAEEGRVLHNEEEEEALAAALEAQLGKPLAEAMREDRLASSTSLPVGEFEDVAKAKVKGEELDSPAIEAAEDAIAKLRAANAPADVVVREARQIFGESLPEGVLHDEEFRVYRRLYGEPVEEVHQPLRALRHADVDEGDDGSDFSAEELAYSQATQDGHKFPQFNSGGTSGIGQRGSRNQVAIEGSGSHLDPVTSTAMGSMDRNVLVQDVARSVSGEVYEADEEVDMEDDEEEDTSPDERAHPFTRLAKFGTSPRTVFLPQDAFVGRAHSILRDFSNVHLKEMCEKTFGGPGLPDSPLSPPMGQKLRPQVPIPLTATQHGMGEMEANAFLTAVMPPTYAAILSVLTETRKRLGSSWLQSLLDKEEGPRILDAGAGGAGILAWREIMKAHSSGNEVPKSRNVVLTGAETLRNRAANLLENTTFIPRLPDYVHTRHGPTLDDDRPIQLRKQFDVVIAPHSLFGLKEEFLRKQHVQNLWSLVNSEGGVLILIEKGVPRGFEAVAGAREMLLNRLIASPGSETYESPLSSSLSQEDQISAKGKGMIIAPCTNHSKCPMYTISGFSRGRKDICSFQQRFIRPPFLQNVLAASDRNHDDVSFSYISVLKGRDFRHVSPQTWNEITDPSHPDVAEKRSTDHATRPSAFAGFPEVHPAATEPSHTPLPLATSLPRVIFAPIKRRGHVTLDLCTPAGAIERWTVPKSFSKQAYRDARKSKWGDLWALGAKTRVPRNLRLGSTLDGKEGVRAEKRRLKELEREEVAEEDHIGAELSRLEIEGEAELRLNARRARTAGRGRAGAAAATTTATTATTTGARADEGEGEGGLLTSRGRRVSEAEANDEFDDDATMEATLKEWEAEFGDTDRRRLRGKHAGEFSGPTAKEAKKAHHIREGQRERERGNWNSRSSASGERAAAAATADPFPGHGPSYDMAGPASASRVGEDASVQAPNWKISMARRKAKQRRAAGGGMARSSSTFGGDDREKRHQPPRR